MRHQKLNNRLFIVRFFRLPVFFGLLISIFGLFFNSCKKEKLEMDFDNRQIQETMSISNIRIINLAGFNQVRANGDSLTNFQYFDTDESPDYKPTRYFPKDGRLGKVWNVQQDLLKSDGTASIILGDKGQFDDVSNSLPEFFIQEDYQQPMDYYAWTNRLIVTDEHPQPLIVGIPRAIEAPSKPDRFKIRIINLTADLTTDIGQEDLVKPVTLAYADGTPVNPLTSGVKQGRWSDYVEVPYGTYQFKVLAPDGRQFSAANMGFYETSNIIDPATSTLAISYSDVSGSVISGLTYAPVGDYKPGGIYSIVVSPNSFNYYSPGGGGGTPSYYQNSFQVIEDISEPANLTYARIQAVHALPETNNITLRVREKSLTSVAFGESSDYERLITGNYHIEAVDASGNTLASTEAELAAGFNYSIWIHPSANGQGKISVVSNNLSGSWYQSGSGDNAVFDRRQQSFPLNVRFLNLCPDEPYITFTGDNGSTIGTGQIAFDQESRINLQPGIIPMEKPYFNLMAPRLTNTYQLMAYRSSPSVVPGAWAKDISPISSQDFIANPNLYNVHGKLPNHEPGIYTVALIGNTKPGTPDTYKARMIIVKHSK